MKPEKINLRYKDEKSDKVYHVFLQKEGGLFVVNFEYGKFDGTLKSGTKTKSAVDYDKAKVIYDKLVKSKTDKGYAAIGDSKDEESKKASMKSVKKSSSSDKYFEELKICIEKKKPVIPILRSIPKKIYNDVAELINPFILEISDYKTRKESDYHHDRKKILFKIRYFLGSTKQMKSYYYNDFIPELEELLLVYVRPDFDELINQSGIRYLIRMDYWKKGYIKRENNHQFAWEVAGCANSVLDKSIKSVLKRLRKHKETLAEDIWLIFNPLISIEGPARILWEDTIKELISKEEISRDKVFKSIYSMNLSVESLSTNQSFRKREAAVMSWFFKFMTSLKPEPEELLLIQEELLASLECDFPAIRKISITFLKKISNEGDFNTRLFIESAAQVLKLGANAEVKAILTIYKGLVKDSNDNLAAIISSCQKALINPDIKAQELLNGFIVENANEKDVKKAQKEIVELKKPKELSADDLGGWTEAEIDKISGLLLSVDDRNVEVALSLLEGRAFPKILISEVFAIVKLTGNESILNSCYKIIEDNGSKNVVEMLEKDFYLSHATESTIKKNIKTYTADNELDGIKIARALYKKEKLGVAYLLSESSEANQKEVFSDFITGTSLNLSESSLTTIPKALFDFTELTSIDLSDNNIATIPPNIKVFKNLKVLNLTSNKIKSIHKNIASLTQLEELYLANNKLKEGIPDYLFDLVGLKKLDLTDLQNQDEQHELSMKILNLKNLERFKLDYHKYSKSYNSYSNYPQIKEVAGNPIDMAPFAIAEAAFDQGDLTPTAYILEHADTKLKKKVLDHYYDSKTKTMDFKHQLLNVIPEDILTYKIEVLNLDLCHLGKGRNYAARPWKKDKEELQKTAIIAKMVDLKELNLKSNYLRELSDLSGLTKLKKLFLEDVFIEKMDNYDKLKNLEELVLDDLDLVAFPNWIFELKNLKMLKLRDPFNKKAIKLKIEDFAGLKKLKNLKKLELSGFKWSYFDKEEFEKVKKYVPAGCDFKD